MKKIILIFLICSFFNCSNDSKKKLAECLGSNDTELLYEGKNLFEDILREFYSKNNLEECYDLYFRDLTIASENLFLLESKPKAIEFVEKIRKQNKVGFFWSKIKSTKYNPERYYINKEKYLTCLSKVSKTKEFKDFFNQLKDTNTEASSAVVAGGLLNSKSEGKTDFLIKERDLSTIYFAFHFYYESILNNELNEQTR